MTSIAENFVTLDRMSNISSTVSTLRLPRGRISPEFSTFCENGMALKHLASPVLLLCGGSDMFKISIFDTPRERRLIVEGNLVDPWVAEFRRAWVEAGNALDGRRVVIDLSGATMIDPEGEAAIGELMRDGAKFCCSGVLTRHVLKRAAEKCHARLRSILDRRHSRQ